MEHGVPEEIVSDRDKLLNATVWSEFLELIHAKGCKTVARRAQADGAVERTNQSILDLLRTTAIEYPRDWDDILPFAAIQYNKAIDPRTGMSPYFLDKGREPIFPEDLPSLVSTPPEPQTEFVKRLDEIMKVAVEKFQKSASKMTSRYNENHREPEVYFTGQYVWLDNPYRESKVAPRKCGPWKITKVSDDGANVTLEIPSYRGHCTFNTENVRPYRSASGKRPYYPLFPKSSDIEGILEHREGRTMRTGTRLDYLVKYRDIEEPVWESDTKLVDKNGQRRPEVTSYLERLKAELQEIEDEDVQAREISKRLARHEHLQRAALAWDQVLEQELTEDPDCEDRDGPSLRPSRSER